MQETVVATRRDSVGVLTIRTPVSKALDARARGQLYEALDGLLADETIATVEVHGAGGFFAATDSRRSPSLEEQSKALLHVFVSEREAARIPGIGEETPRLPVGSAAVLGAGTMGAGIAMVLADAGIPVLLKETDPAALDRGMATIAALYTNAAKHGRLTPADVRVRMARITPTLSYDGFGAIDLVIEAVFEGIALKQAIFRELEAVCRPDAVLATNTSTLNIDDIASAVSRRERVIGTHFFTPPHVTRLLEIVRGRATSAEVAATAVNLAKRLGKLGVAVGNCRGFVANRMFLPYFRAAEFLLEEGATPAGIDGALHNFGMAIGPMLVSDLVGHDLLKRIRMEHLDLHASSARQPFLEDRLCALGRYGRKTGSGWYLYDEKKHASVDPEMDGLVRDWSAAEGIVQRTVTSAEIVERCVYALINEGARIVEEGFAERVSDVDLIFVNGYGFPAWRGGPMWYADTIGVKMVYDRIMEWHAAEGENDDWAPAPLLKRLAEEGGGFHQHIRDERMPR